MPEVSAWFEDLQRRARAARGEAVGWSRYGIRPSRKDRIAVVTDSSAALPDIVTNLPTGGELEIIPMPVMVGDQIYPDRSPEIEHELPLAIAAGTPVKTSRPAPGAFREVFNNLAAQGYTKVLVVVLSAKLSGTYDAAKLAAAKAPLSVEVVDSGTGGMALGHAVLDALIRSHTGATLEYLANVVRTQAQASQAYFTVPNLDQLRRGGRISAMTGFLGQLLQVRPLLTLKDGEIDLLERPRSVERSLHMMTDRVKKATKKQGARLTVHYYGNEINAREYALTLKKYSTAPIPVVPLPSVLAAHLGLGTLAVCINPEIDYT